MTTKVPVLEPDECPACWGFGVIPLPAAPGEPVGEGEDDEKSETCPFCHGTGRREDFEKEE